MTQLKSVMRVCRICTLMLGCKGLIRTEQTKRNAMYLTRGRPAIVSSFFSIDFSLLFCSLVSVAGTSTTRVRCFDQSVLMLYQLFFGV